MQTARTDRNRAVITFYCFQVRKNIGKHQPKLKLRIVSVLLMDLRAHLHQRESTYHTVVLCEYHVIHLFRLLMRRDYVFNIV